MASYEYMEGPGMSSIGSMRGVVPKMSQQDLINMMEDDDSSASTLSTEGSDEVYAIGGDGDNADNDEDDSSISSTDGSLVDELHARVEAFTHVGSTPALAQMVFDRNQFSVPSRRPKRYGNSSLVSRRSSKSVNTSKSNRVELFTPEEIKAMLLQSEAIRNNSAASKMIERDSISLGPMRKSVSEVNLYHSHLRVNQKDDNSVASGRSSRSGMSNASLFTRIGKETKPWDFLGMLLGQQGISISKFPYTDISEDFFFKLEQKHFSAYDNEIAAATRSGNLEVVKARYKSGKPLLSCNKFKETIVHTICRRGHIDLLRYIVEETDISIQLVDDIGRNPLHDACWTHRPNFKLVKLLLQACPNLVYISDNRGFTPLCYVGKPCWREWCKFLDDNQDLLVPRSLPMEEA